MQVCKWKEIFEFLGAKKNTFYCYRHFIVTKRDVVRENAVENPPSYMEESAMDIAHTDCSIPIDHEVAVSPVTRVPIEPVSLMKEIHMEEDEYLRIKVAQS